MIYTNYRYDFIERHSKNCTAEQLYQNYRYYYSKYAESNSKTEIGCLADCLWYLKKLISRYKPEKVIKMLFDIEKLPYNKMNIEKEYVYLMNKVARIHLFY